MPKITSKGQVTIPKRIRDSLGLETGSEVEFGLGRDGEIVLKTKAKPRKGRFDELVGTLDLGMTTDEFMRMIRGDPEE